MYVVREMSKAIGCLTCSYTVPRGTSLCAGTMLCMKDGQEARAYWGPSVVAVKKRGILTAKVVD